MDLERILTIKLLLRYSFLLTVPYIKNGRCVEVGNGGAQCEYQSSGTPDISGCKDATGCSSGATCVRNGIGGGACIINYSGLPGSSCLDPGGLTVYNACQSGYICTNGTCQTKPPPVTVDAAGYCRSLGLTVCDKGPNAGTACSNNCPSSSSAGNGGQGGGGAVANQGGNSDNNCGTNNQNCTLNGGRCYRGDSGQSNYCAGSVVNQPAQNKTGGGGSLGNSVNSGTSLEQTCINNFGAGSTTCGAGCCTTGNYCGTDGLCYANSGTNSGTNNNSSRSSNSGSSNYSGTNNNSGGSGIYCTAPGWQLTTASNGYQVCCPGQSTKWGNYPYACVNSPAVNSSDLSDPANYTCSQSVCGQQSSTSNNSTGRTNIGNSSSNGLQINSGSSQSSPKSVIGGLCAKDSDCDNTISVKSGQKISCVDNNMCLVTWSQKDLNAPLSNTNCTKDNQDCTAGGTLPDNVCIGGQRVGSYCIPGKSDNGYGCYRDEECKSNFCKKQDGKNGPNDPGGCADKNQSGQSGQQSGQLQIKLISCTDANRAANKETACWEAYNAGQPCTWGDRQNSDGSGTPGCGTMGQARIGAPCNWDNACASNYCDTATNQCAVPQASVQSTDQFEDVTCEGKDINGCQSLSKKNNCAWIYTKGCISK